MFLNQPWLTPRWHSRIFIPLSMRNNNRVEVQSRRSVSIAFGETLRVLFLALNWPYVRIRSSHAYSGASPMQRKHPSHYLGSSVGWASACFRPTNWKTHWSRLVSSNLRLTPPLIGTRALTGLDRDCIEMREVSPMRGLPVPVSIPHAAQPATERTHRFQTQSPALRLPLLRVCDPHDERPLCVGL